MLFECVRHIHGLAALFMQYANWIVHWNCTLCLFRCRVFYFNLNKRTSFEPRNHWSLLISRSFSPILSFHFATISFFSYFCVMYNWDLVSSSLSSARAIKKTDKIVWFCVDLADWSSKRRKKSALHENGCKFCATTLDASANSLVSFSNQAWQRTRAFCTTIYMTGKSVPQLCACIVTLMAPNALSFFCASSVDSII